MLAHNQFQQLIHMEKKVAWKQVKDEKLSSEEKDIPDSKKTEEHMFSTATLLPKGAGILTMKVHFLFPATVS